MLLKMRGQISKVTYHMASFPQTPPFTVLLTYTEHTLPAAALTKRVGFTWHKKRKISLFICIVLQLEVNNSLLPRLLLKGKKHNKCNCRE